MSCENCWGTGYYKGYGAPCGECSSTGSSPTGFMEQYNKKAEQYAKGVRKGTRVLVNDLSETPPKYAVGMRVRVVAKDQMQWGDRECIGEITSVRLLPDLFEVQRDVDYAGRHWYVDVAECDIEVLKS